MIKILLHDIASTDLSIYKEHQKWDKDIVSNSQMIPKYIAIGGNPPTKINLLSESIELSVDSDKINKAAFDESVAMVIQEFGRIQFAGSEDSMQANSKEFITSVANKIKSGTWFPLHSSPYEERVAIAISGAYLYNSGELQAEIDKARGSNAQSYPPLEAKLAPNSANESIEIITNDTLGLAHQLARDFHLDNNKAQQLAAIIQKENNINPDNSIGLHLHISEESLATFVPAISKNTVSRPGPNWEKA